MRRTKALIVAGSYNQAEVWATWLGFKRSEWRYFGAATHGFNDVPVYLVGTYCLRKDWPELLVALAPLGHLILAEEMVPRGG